MKETSLNVDAEHWWGSIIGGAFGAECAVKYVIYDPYYVLEVGGKERRTRRLVPRPQTRVGTGPSYPDRSKSDAALNTNGCVNIHYIL